MNGELVREAFGRSLGDGYRTRRGVVAGLGALVGSAVLAACGGDAAPVAPAAPTKAPAAAAPTTAAAAAKPTEVPAAKPATTASTAAGTVRYFTWGNAFSDGIEKKVIDAFQAKQDKVKIEFTNSQADHYTKLTAAIAGGDPPDTALVDGYQLRNLIKKGGAKELTSLMSRDGIKKEDYVDAWFDEFIYKGKFYYHPNMRGSSASFFYNKNLIEKMGAKVPAEGWTLDDWLAIAQVTTRDGKGASPTQSGFDPATATFGTERPGLWWPFLWANGGDLVDMEKNVCALDQPASIESLQFLTDLQHKYKVTRNSFAGVPASADLFVQGRLAVVHGWFTEIPRYRTEIKDFEWDTVVMPQGKAKKQTGLYKGNGQVIPTGAKNPDAAWEFQKFLGSYEGMLIFGVEGRFVPALKKANQDPKFLDKAKSPKNLSTFTDSRVKTLPLMPEWEEFNRDVWNPALDRLWKGEVTAKEVVVDVVRRTNEMIKNREQY